MEGVSNLFGLLYFFLVSSICLVHGELTVVTRAEWNAKAATNAEMTPLVLPADRVIIAHTAGNECKTKVC